MIEKLKQLRSEIEHTLVGFYYLDRLISHVEVFLLGLLVIGLVLAEFWTIFIHSYTWLKQLFKYAVVWIGLLGASLATQSGEHISITVIPPQINSRLRSTIQIVVNLSSAIITLLLAMAALDYLQYEWQNVASGKAAPSEADVCKIYLPNDKMSELQRRADELETQSQARIMLTVGNLAGKDREEIIGDLDAAREQIQQRQKIADEMATLQQEWLQQNQPQWQAALAQAWAKEGEVAWEAVREQYLPTGEAAYWFRMKWQEAWARQQWQSTWKAQAEAAWQTQGQASRPADVAEEDYRHQWQEKWATQSWQTSWRSELAAVWRSQGHKDYFKTKWCEGWLNHRWQQDWQNSWRQTIMPASTILLREPPNMAGYQAVAWKIPRWILLIIIPIALFIMAFRFSLRTLLIIFKPELLG